MLLHLLRPTIALQLMLLGSCSLDVTGMQIRKEIPTGSYTWHSPIILYSCTVEDTANRVPDFSGLQRAMNRGCPDAVGLARADIQLIAHKRKPGSDSFSTIHCWTMRGYPVFPDNLKSGCNQSSNLKILNATEE